MNPDNRVDPPVSQAPEQVSNGSVTPESPQAPSSPLAPATSDAVVGTFSDVQPEKPRKTKSLLVVGGILISTALIAGGVFAFLQAFQSNASFENNSSKKAGSNTKAEDSSTDLPVAYEDEYMSLHLPADWQVVTIDVHGNKQTYVQPKSADGKPTGMSFDSDNKTSNSQGTTAAEYYSTAMEGLSPDDVLSSNKNPINEYSAFETQVKGYDENRTPQWNLIVGNTSTKVWFYAEANDPNIEIYKKIINSIHIK